MRGLNGPWPDPLPNHDPLATPNRLGDSACIAGLVAPGRFRYHRGPATNP